MSARRRPTTWITMRTLADALDLSVSATHKLLGRVPARCVRRHGRRLLVYGPAAVAAALRPRLRRVVRRELEAEALQAAEVDASIELEFSLLCPAQC